VTAVKSGSVYLNISLVVGKNNRRTVEVWRSYAMPEPRPRMMSTVHFVERVVSDGSLAKRYDVTAEQAEKLKELGVKLPTLTKEEQGAVTELFLAAEAARREMLAAAKKPAAARAATTATGPATAAGTQPDPKKKAAEAEAALLAGAAKLAVPAGELDALAEAAAEAREILRPDQLDLIDSDFDRGQSGMDRPGYLRRRQ
jgi:hypothetical protein